MAIESKLGVEDSQPDTGADGADDAKVSDAKVEGDHCQSSRTDRASSVLSLPLISFSEPSYHQPIPTP